MTCKTEPAAAPTARVRRMSRREMDWLGMRGPHEGEKFNTEGTKRREHREHGEKNEERFLDCASRHVRRSKRRRKSRLAPLGMTGKESRSMIASERHVKCCP